MPAIGHTPNFALALPYGNKQNWTDLINGNMRVLDAIIATFVSVTNLQGAWENSTAYTIGQNVIDETSGVVYTAQVNHTSSGPPTTFLEERTNHPTYWLTFSVAARQRGAWQTNTAYALNDFVLADGTKYAMCVTAHTSGANFSADLALGYWQVMIDLSTAGSLVLPVLSGAADANKFVITNAGGTSYTINAASVAASLLNAAGLATLANPAFTGNPTAPTQTAEDNDTSIATTNYADRAVRALIPRVQTFSANGTYTPNPKMVYCEIDCLGAGGGGGGTASASASTFAAGGGGGAGGRSISVATAATIGSSQAVTVGTAGTAGAAGNNAGGNGGDTSVGTICIAKGGSGGGGCNGSTGIPTNGAGGILGTGDATGTGQNGGYGVVIAPLVNSGNGGSTHLGGGGLGAVTATSATGGSGTGRGAGGGSGASFSGSAAAAGGAGTAGYVVITEYCYG